MTQLDFEVDFDYKPGMVGLRFFERDEDGDRYPLRAQRLYNLSVQAKRDRSLLDPAVRDFLLKLAPELSKPAVISANLQIVVVSATVWERLRDHAAVRQADLRDHASGAVMSASGEPVPLNFELECHGDQTIFSAVVKTSSGSVPWTRICDGARQRRVGGKNPETIIEAMVDGVLQSLDLPVEVGLLNQLFRTDNQRIRTDAIVGSLPVLIDRRLDRLHGPSVTHRREGIIPTLSITTDGAYIVLKPHVKGTTLAFDHPWGTMRLIREGDGFAVVDYRCRHYSRLKRLLQDMGTSECDAGYRVQGNAETVAKLTALMAKLPIDLPIERSGGLEHLTNQPATIKTTLDVQDHGAWFDYGIQCRAGEKTVELADLRRASRDASGVIRTRDGSWLKLNETDLTTCLELAESLDDTGRGTQLRTEFGSTLERIQGLPNMAFHASAKELASRVRKDADRNHVTIGEALKEPLRQYQREGVDFLCSRLIHGVGALLADDMGLGKTLQVLTASVALQSAGTIDGPILVVCPASVIHVWEGEAARFFPELTVAMLNGSPQSRRDALRTSDFDLAVCSYAVLRNDLEHIHETPFSLAVLDEAQTIRNPDAQITQAAWDLRIPRRLALTGTPLENRLTDLWSIMTFLNPGYLGNRTAFAERYGSSGNQQLTDRLRPLMLRRRKREVAADLPSRTEEVIKIPFEPEQANVYARQLALARKGGRNTMQLLAALTKLRQVCCHPALIKDGFDAAVGKMILLREIVHELVDEGHSVLIFSQFTTMLERIREALEDWNIDHLMLTGKTPVADRKRLVDGFNATDAPQTFLLSLKAAGTGLTLTKADYVVIFDPWWNPAAESQAIDRTHRIGQTKPVIAYRFIMAGSVEEKVLDLQKGKKELFQSVVDGVGTAETAISAEELAGLLD